MYKEYTRFWYTFSVFLFHPCARKEVRNLIHITSTIVVIPKENGYYKRKYFITTCITLFEFLLRVHSDIHTWMLPAIQFYFLFFSSPLSCKKTTESNKQAHLLVWIAFVLGRKDDIAWDLLSHLCFLTHKYML